MILKALISVLFPAGLIIIICMSSAIPAVAYPHTLFEPGDLASRADPVFPDQPPSCLTCAQNYDNIDTCVEAAPVLANVSMIIFNPGAFVSVIECACTDTFQAVYPQCVDCFQKTGQTHFLNTPNIPAVLSGLRTICGVASTILGNVSNVDGESPTTSSGINTPSSTATNHATTLSLLSPGVLAAVICMLLSLQLV